MELITQTEFAKMVGVSQPYIAKLIRKGVFIDCIKDKKLIKKCALKAYYNSKKRKSIEDYSRLSPLQKVQVKKDEWAAKLNELHYRVQTGEFKDREEIDKRAENVLVAFRNKMLALPTKAAPVLVGMNDEEKIKAIIVNYIDEALSELERLKELSD